MLKRYNVSELEGKVSDGVLKAYISDFGNFQISSIIAGFHRTFGHRNEGMRMSLDIVNSIKDDTLNFKERNILIWNLYMLSSEFIDEGMYEKALEFINRAQYNWSRDIILGDEIGVYHVSWLEQLWQKCADIFFLLGDRTNFSKESEKILSSRRDFFNKAEEITGETIALDRCSYACLDLMAFETKKYDIEKAIELIKEAIQIKEGKVTDFSRILGEGGQNESKGFLDRAYWKYLRYYYSLHEQPYDNIDYTYCCTCKEYKEEKCKIHNIEVEGYKCCSKYRN